MTVTSPCAGKDRQSDRQTHISHLVQREDEQSYKKTDTPPCAGGDNQTDTRIPPCEEGKWTIIQKDRHPHPMQMETDNRTDKHTHTHPILCRRKMDNHTERHTPPPYAGGDRHSDRQTHAHIPSCAEGRWIIIQKDKYPTLCRGGTDN